MGTYTKLLCTKILERCLLSTSTDGSSQTDLATLQSSIYKHKDVRSQIIDLQAGQEVNSIAIQSLSHVDRLADIISQSGKEMVKNQQNKDDKNPVSSQGLPIKIPEESTQSLANESLITLGTSLTKNDVNSDGSGLLTISIKYPSEAKESTRSSEAEKLGQTTSYESLSTSKSGEARSEGNGDRSILLIGDSIIKNINPRKLSRNKVIKRTFPGKSAEEIISEVKKIKSDPTYIILHVGMNNLLVDDPIVCVEKIRNLAININKKFPKSTIGLSSITTRRDLNLEEQIEKVNVGLLDFCTKNKFNFIDNRNLDSSCLNGSLLHLNVKGSALLATNFIKFLRANTSASTIRPNQRRSQDFLDKTARLSFLEDILSVMLSPQRPINRSRRS